MRERPFKEMSFERRGWLSEKMLWNGLEVEQSLLYSIPNRNSLNHFRQRCNLEKFTFYKYHLVNFMENGKKRNKSRNQKALRLSTAFVAQWKQDGKLDEELVSNTGEVLVIFEICPGSRISRAWKPWSPRFGLRSEREKIFYLIYTQRRKICQICCYDECKEGKFIVSEVFNPSEGEGRPP